MRQTIWPGCPQHRLHCGIITRSLSLYQHYSHNKLQGCKMKLILTILSNFTSLVCVCTVAVIVIPLVYDSYCRCVILDVWSRTSPLVTVDPTSGLVQVGPSRAAKWNWFWYFVKFYILGFVCVLSAVSFLTRTFYSSLGGIKLVGENDISRK